MTATIDKATQERVLAAIRGEGWTDEQGAALIRSATRSKRFPEGRTANVAMLTTDELDAVRVAFREAKAGRS